MTPQPSCSQILALPALTWRWKLSSRRAFSSMVALVRRSPAKEPGRFSSSWMRWAMRAWSLQRRDFRTSSAHSQPWEQGKGIGKSLPESWDDFWGPPWEQGHSVATEGQRSWDGSGRISKENILQLIPLDLGKTKNGMQAGGDGRNPGGRQGKHAPTHPSEPLDIRKREKRMGGKLGIPRNMSSCSSRGVTGSRNVGNPQEIQEGLYLYSRSCRISTGSRPRGFWMGVIRFCLGWIGSAGGAGCPGEGGGGPGDAGGTAGGTGEGRPAGGGGSSFWGAPPGAAADSGPVGTGSLGIPAQARAQLPRGSGSQFPQKKLMIWPEMKLKSPKT